MIDYINRIRLIQDIAGRIRPAGMPMAVRKSNADTTARRSR